MGTSVFQVTALSFTAFVESFFFLIVNKPPQISVTSCNICPHYALSGLFFPEVIFVRQANIEKKTDISKIHAFPEMSVFPLVLYAFYRFCCIFFLGTFLHFFQCFSVLSLRLVCFCSVSFSSFFILLFSYLAWQDSPASGEGAPEGIIASVAAAPCDLV